MTARDTTEHALLTGTHFQFITPFKHKFSEIRFDMSIATTAVACSHFLCLKI
jgi:hypothetical protein